MITQKHINTDGTGSAQILLEQAEVERIIGSYFGHINDVYEIGNGRLLVEAHIAEAGDDGWECGEWYVVDADGVHHICTCYGYDKDIEITDQQRYAEITAIGDGLITPYYPYGLQARATAASRQEATGSDDDCNIEITRDFYGDIYNNHPYLLKDDGDDVISMAFVEAQAWIEQQESEVYHLAHNESGRPKYRIVKA